MAQKKKGLQGLGFNLLKCRKSHKLIQTWTRKKGGGGGEFEHNSCPQGGNLKKTIYKGSNIKGVIFMLKYNNP